MTSIHSTLDARLAFLAMVHVQAILISRYPANLAAGLLVSFGGVLALALATRMFTPITSGASERDRRRDVLWLPAVRLSLG